MLTKQTNIKLATFLACVLLLTNCKTSKYAATDKVNKDMAKGFSKIIKTVPPVNQTIDSLNNEQYWVGTVNMGMRKPNFVVMRIM